jgi:hypothetical protein
VESLLTKLVEGNAELTHFIRHSAASKGEQPSK